jgi:hypothetical protein
VIIEGIDASAKVDITCDDTEIVHRLAAAAAFDRDRNAADRAKTSHVAIVVKCVCRAVEKPHAHVTWRRW